MVSNASTGTPNFNELFQTYCKDLDSVNAKRERLVKASRDITQQSKKLIFALHRLQAGTRAASIQKCTAEQSRITHTIATRICLELSSGDAPRYARAFSAGIQEYVEASLLLHFCKHATLLSRDALESRLSAACDSIGATPLPLDPADYVLGAADLGGELMRLAVSAAGRGALAEATQIRDFLLAFQALLATPRSSTRYVATEVESKARVLATSIGKVERACFDLCVRRSEFSTQRPVRPRSDSGDTAPSKRRRV